MSNRRVTKTGSSHTSYSCIIAIQFTHRIDGNLKLLRESTNADRKRLKIVFSIANCFNAYRSALLDSRNSSQLPTIRCDSGYSKRKRLKFWIKPTLISIWCIPTVWTRAFAVWMRKRWNIGNLYNKLSHVTRKPIFGNLDQVRLKQAWSATVAS